jgi:hypothetical protein
MLACTTYLKKQRLDDEEAVQNRNGRHGSRHQTPAIVWRAWRR